MKYGDEITKKLEQLVKERTKSPKEWECFKKQVLHCFTIAEKIGNREVNPEAHMQWEERLIRLGILERRVDYGKKPKNYRESQRVTKPDNSSGKERRKSM